ncbi:MAG: hypothetical protein ACI4LO_07520 [Anaerovoracaceae bacterium]
MKKFVLTVVLLALIALGGYYLVYYQGFYLNMHKGTEYRVIACTEGKNIYTVNKDGKKEPFVIRGVDLPSSVAGHFASDYAVDEKTWIRWFGQIQEMGANTIRIYTIYDDTFYNAFYKYNLKREEPLYLMQGIQVSDYANNSGQDAYSDDFYGNLKKDSKSVIDVVHGKRNIHLNSLKGSGFYRKDISPWVLGYIVGSDWGSGTVAYTDKSGKYSNRYEGSVISTGKGASAFEAMLAEIMDGMVCYEQEKYAQQRLIAFINDPSNDPFEYRTYYGRQLGKYNRIDAEKIVPDKEKFNGYFAAYQIYNFCPDFEQYFSGAEKKRLENILGGIDKEKYYGGYAQLLAEYHTMPVVIAGYGYSTARGTDNRGGALTERQQGEMLLEAYKDILKGGCAGAYISSWQDSWERRTWNTSYASDITENMKWHDVQTMDQNNGILAFVPGRERPVCLVDGNVEEWEASGYVSESEGIRLSVKYDLEYFYIMAQGSGISEDRPLYIPIDTISGLGSRRSAEPELSFERNADFLICIDGKAGSSIKVQERYDSLRENYLEKITGEDPFENPPAKDSDRFVPIRMILSNDRISDPLMEEAEMKELSYFETVETGALKYGNADPEAGDYNSLADFCFGKNCVEIRIPWALMNFSNPADMKIHKDYYECYGRESMGISELYIGCGYGNDTIKMQSVPMKKQRIGADYHERLKESYEVLKKGWRNI